MAPQLVEIVDVPRAQRVHSSGAGQQLEKCHVHRWGLSLECPTPEDPVHEAEITWLLPRIGVRLTRYRTRRFQVERGPTFVSAVHVSWDNRAWSTTDLLLGLQVPERGCARIVRYDDFATAISTGVIRLSEADYALHTVHRTLEELSKHRDLNQWLAYQGIFDLW